MLISPFLGTRFGLQKLVELIPATQTSEETLARARAYAIACGKGEQHSGRGPLLGHLFCSLP